MSPESDRPSSKLIRKVLSPAVRLWLRSQAELIAELELQIEGDDRQILSGYIPKVAIAARHAVYQGLYLSQVDVVGETIRVNLGQVMKGKPLKLLEAVPICGSLLWDEADLNASLKAPVLSNALAEFFLNWMRSEAHLLPEVLAQAIQKPLVLQDAQAEILPHQVALRLNWGMIQEPPMKLSSTLQTGLSLVSENRLKLEQPVIGDSEAASPTALPDYEVELGDVVLQDLRLELGKILVQGRIHVLP
jgi:LmeA-like phospholipid-binding